MWHLPAEDGARRIRARDETLRDGNQGEAPRSAYRGIRHLIEMSPHYDQLTIGWIYTNPADIELANYLREHGEAIHERQENFDRKKFFIYSLVHRGHEQEPEAVNSQLPFGKMLRDLQSGQQPYGAVNILTKARVDDLKDLGEHTTSESIRADFVNTIRLIQKANPDVNVEFAMEHVHTAWLEPHHQAENRAHILGMMADYLQTLAPDKQPVITLPDTDGAHTPDQIRQTVQEITAALKNQGIRFEPSMLVAHMHDDREYAVENTMSMLKAGAGGMDLAAGQMGERRGNTTAAAMASKLTHRAHADLAAYQSKLEYTLGIRPGDKQIGKPDAYLAVGGMHADHLLKKLREQQPHGVTHAEFTRGYRGSYASAPPDEFGQKIEVTLSPVAGASNVLFMLAGMGLDLKDKKDPRVAAVLEEVKRAEHEDGLNYRGHHNANALLLLARTFGLYDAFDEGIADRLSATAAPVEWNDASVLRAAKAQLAEATRQTAAGDPRFKRLEITEARVMEAPVGALHAKGGDPLDPQPASQRYAVKLLFTSGEGEQHQANGAAASKEEALGMAVQTAVDFCDFQLARQRLRPSDRTVRYGAGGWERSC